MFVPPSSIGDVIVICQVVSKIAVVICQARERPKDFAELESELDSLYQVLQEIKKLYEPSSPANVSIISDSLQKQVGECNSIMDEFMQKNSPPKKWYRKIFWVLREAGRAESLRRKLSVQRLNLIAVLETFNSLLGTSQHRILLSEMKDFRTEIRDLHLRMRGVDLQDATGGVFTISLDFCHSYEMVLDYITVYYNHRSNELPGRDLVLQGQFKLVHGDKNASIEQELWHSILSPGLLMKMSMILLQRGQRKNQCPRCRVVSNDVVDDGWVTCSTCQKAFQITERIVEENKEDGNEVTEAEGETKLSGDSEDMTVSSLNSNRGPAPRSSSGKQNDELGKFRLISILLLKEKHERIDQRKLLQKSQVVVPTQTSPESDDDIDVDRIKITDNQIAPNVPPHTLSHLHIPFRFSDDLGNVETFPFVITTASLSSVNSRSISSSTSRSDSGRNSGALWQCNICNTGFDRHARYEAHMNTHAGSRPYECKGTCGEPGCNMAFPSVEALSGHRINKTRIVCDKCGNLVPKKNMDRHLQFYCASRYNSHA